MPDLPLGDRMKLYEGYGTQYKLIPLVPVAARIDGVCFHTWTKGLMRPYDERLCILMKDTAAYLLKETGADLAYTQSDEISLGWMNDDYRSEMYFNGKISKLNSVIASKAAAFFNSKVEDILPKKHNELAVFDCRIWNVPNLTELANTFYWREMDATRNSIQMAGQSVFSHKSLMHKSCSQIQEMLFQQEGINWNDYPTFFKKGVYIHNKKIMVSKQEDLSLLPEKHHARITQNLNAIRTDVVELEIPPLSRIENKAGVLFLGEEIVQKV